MGLKAAATKTAFGDVQALLRMTHLASGAAAYFAFSDFSSDETLTFTVTTAGLAKQIGSRVCPAHALT